MKTLLLFIFLIIQPVSRELIYNNTGFERNEAIINPYIPSSKSSNKPYKVQGYDADNNFINTDGMGNPYDPTRGMWVDGYSYFQDKDGYWYRTKDGIYWEKWSSILDLGIIIWRWRPGRSPTGVTTQYWKDKQTPIGSPICMILFAGGYYIWRKRKNELCLG